MESVKCKVLRLNTVTAIHCNFLSSNLMVLSRVLNPQKTGFK